MTLTQLAVLLEQFHEPAGIVDGAGELAAANQGGRHIDWKAAPAPGSSVTAIELGDGWKLLRRTNGHSDAQTLARGIAHEIRNPLSAILTAIKLVHDDPGLTEESTMLLEIVKKESHRMNRILSEFSTYVKPVVPQPSIFDAATALRTVTRTLKTDGGLGEGIEVIDELPEQLLCYADEVLCEQVFLRILHNAAQAMGETGQLRLAGNRKDGKTIVHITDSGPRLTEETLERAFQPFFSRTSGAGLGLPIARASVESMGGHITIENRAQQGNDEHGAFVCIELPGAQSEPRP